MQLFVTASTRRRWTRIAAEEIAAFPVLAPAVPGGDLDGGVSVVRPGLRRHLQDGFFHE